jgi:hypothetical protein
MKTLNHFKQIKEMAISTPLWADSGGGVRWNRWGWFNLQ